MKKSAFATKKSGQFHVYVKPKMELSEQKSESAKMVLSTLLSNEITIYAKTRKFHWSVSGEDLVKLNDILQTHYRSLEESIRTVAARINKLGYRSIGIANELIKFPDINDVQSSSPSSKEMIRELLADHETEITNLRNEIGYIMEKYKDIDTADFLISRIEIHESIARVLRRILFPSSHYTAHSSYMNIFYN